MSPKAVSPSPPPLILYVENNEYLLHIVRDLLELCGWVVICCYSGMAADALIRKRDYAFDLLLLDHELSDATGLGLARIARSMPHRKHTPIILLALEDCANEAQKVGVNAFLRKPNHLPDLLNTIKGLLKEPRQSAKGS